MRWLVRSAVVLGHVWILAWSAWCHSPTFDEGAHLVAGLSYWHFGRFDLYNVNPPLTRLIAAAPVALSDAEVKWEVFHTHATERPEFFLGSYFIEANGYRSQKHFCLARIALIPFSVIGAIVCCHWASRLYGASAGTGALVMWCSCPNVIAFASLITPDVAATSLGIASAYCFWRWVTSNSWKWAIASGVMLGVTEQTKTLWIVCFGLWPLLYVFVGSRRPKGLAQLAAVLVIALYVVNLGYGFEGSGNALGSFCFVSTTALTPLGPRGHVRPDCWLGLGLVGMFLGGLAWMPWRFAG